MLWQSFDQTRSTIYKYLTDSSNGKLRLEIKSQANRASYVNEIIKLAQGTGIRHDSLRLLGDNITPVEFVNYVTGRQVKKLSGDKGLTRESANKLVENILSNDEKMKDCLAIPYDKIPEDVPKIEYRKRFDSFPAA